MEREGGWYRGAVTEIDISRTIIRYFFLQKQNNYTKTGGRTTTVLCCGPHFCSTEIFFWVDIDDSSSLQKLYFLCVLSTRDCTGTVYRYHTLVCEYINIPIVLKLIYKNTYKNLPPAIYCDCLYIFIVLNKICTSSWKYFYENFFIWQFILALHCTLSCIFPSEI